eukprot:TRINITY_DN25736_c0_g1_i2.p1 TRINITY_DN25736_c0_g1~~TRINITY_DN25736_c0_g1_i2.p1  ORF type:complete len:601 (-),score=105.25 TRINITY_DN25736_c0_g1_i2:5-1807(-)
MARDVARGAVEGKIAEVVDMKDRMEQADSNGYFSRLEERDDNITNALERGVISEQEAGKLRARQKLHKRQDEESKSKPAISAVTMAGADHQSAEQMIEEALARKHRNFYWDLLWRTLKLDKLVDRIDREKFRRKLPKYKHSFPTVHAMVTSSSFELMMFIIVMANGVLTGIQISVYGTEDNLPIYQTFEDTFTIVFMCEVVLRLLADGWTWIFDWGNATDFLLIMGTGFIPTFILKPVVGFENPTVRIGQAIRCLRLIKILKKVRVYEMFRIPWSLVSGILDSVRVMNWTLVIIFSVLYMFSIFLSQLLLHQDMNWTEAQQEVIDGYFKTVPEAVWTLFQIMTLDSWAALVRPFQDDAPATMVTFLVYICVSAMVLNNLVIATIVNNAFIRLANDEELQASIVRKQADEEMEDLRRLFDDMDIDGGGYLTRDEYELATHNNEDLARKLKLANLVPDEIENLWDWLEFEDEIDAETFATEVRNLKGICKAKQSFAVSVKLKTLDKRIQVATAQMEKNKNTSMQLRNDVGSVQVELSKAMLEVRHFMILAQRCIPKDPSVTSKKVVEKFAAKMSDDVYPLMTHMILGVALPFVRVGRGLNGF